MPLHDRLVEYIQIKIKELDKELEGDLKDDTSLIKSGLFDSLALLHLAVWIEEELDSELDLTEIDLSKEWDTIDDILNFIERHREANPARTRESSI